MFTKWLGRRIWGANACLQLKQKLFTLKQSAEFLITLETTCLDNPSFLSDFLTGKANLHRNEINQKMILWTVVRLVPLQKVHTVSR